MSKDFIAFITAIFLGLLAARLDVGEAQPGHLAKDGKLLARSGSRALVMPLALGMRTTY